MTTLETTISGIPCKVRVSRFKQVRGNHSPVAEDPDEYHGYTICEYEVTDSRGRPAPWLERKLTSADESRIEAEIAEYMQEERYAD